MKKSILLLLVVLSTTFSCQQSNEETMQQVGFEINKDGSKTALVAGDLSSVAVWEKYIQAHNERDLQTIAALNSSNFKAYGPRGEFIDGTAAHIEFLKNWFGEANPRWSSKFLIANAFKDKEGKTQQWVTSGHDLKLTVNEETVEVVQIHDALILDGKVKMFNVYERVKSEKE